MHERAMYRMCFSARTHSPTPLFWWWAAGCVGVGSPVTSASNIPVRGRGQAARDLQCRRWLPQYRGRRRLLIDGANDEIGWGRGKRATAHARQGAKVSRYQSVCVVSCANRVVAEVRVYGQRRKERIHSAVRHARTCLGIACPREYIQYILHPDYYGYGDTDNPIQYNTVVTIHRAHRAVKDLSNGRCPAALYSTPRKLTCRCFGSALYQQPTILPHQPPSLPPVLPSSFPPSRSSIFSFPSVSASIPSFPACLSPVPCT